MSTLSIDIETYSSIDLKTAGVYRYAQAPDFEVLLLAYAFGDEPVQIIDLASSPALPRQLFEALIDPAVKKTAHNAAFERVCLQRHLRTPLPIDQWHCTMAAAAQLSLPLDLETAAKVLKLPFQKDAAGKALIKYFSVPCKPTKTNGGRTRNLPEHAPEKWADFKAYCMQDVEVERAIKNKLRHFEAPATERRLYILDQQINDRGVKIDVEFVRSVIRLNEEYTAELVAEAEALTGLENPNSVAQLKDWLNKEWIVPVDSLNKHVIAELLTEAEAGSDVARLLELRQQMSKTSVKKYQRMLQMVCDNGRVHGLLQYCGAGRTWRWAGRGVQVHNLPRNEMDHLDLARRIVKDGELEELKLFFDNVPYVLSQLLRTAFVAGPGHRLLPADYSAIEARVLAWLAGEKWRLDVFNTHGKIYEASASQMFKVPLEAVTKGSPYRQKGKVAELALGYQGGPHAIQSMEISSGTPKHKRIPEEELPGLVASWRRANPAIVRYWYKAEEAALKVVSGEAPRVDIGHGVVFLMERGVLFIQLPSGRRLAYLSPELRPNKFGKEAIYYQGFDQDKKKWGAQQTYGGKLTENIVQAVARDCLAVAMLRADAADYLIAFHVHDEIVAEMPYGKGSAAELCQIISKPIHWAPGLPLKAEGFETEYYKKD